MYSDNSKKTIRDILKLLYDKAESQKVFDNIDFINPYIVAADGQFLGVFSNEFDSNSIFNQYSTFGSKYSSYSILNRYNIYGSKYSAYSPYNEYTTTPPKIFYRNQEICYLTKNKYLPNSIDPEVLLDELNKTGLNYVNWYLLFNRLKNKF